MNLRPRRSEPPRVDITPLIDVVFLMLIFFMVSTTFDKQTQLKVDLPKASSSEVADDTADKIDITIDAQGHFYVNERELVKHDPETLRRTMDKIADGRPDLPIIVSGDRNAPLQSMMTVLDVAAQLGMSRLSFVARQSDEPDVE
ncbi:MAG: biopolymer transporter ExbD [Chromatiaceae bacterium]|jgi:biopolymer transport protein ExbD|nr:biopolymer transporter ExbD [Chromatiaceae bacterium]